MTMVNTLKKTASAMTAGFSFVNELIVEENPDDEGRWHFVQVWCADLEHDWR